jgi:DNA invertase Pin-like site-specific DNA recombinase
MTVGYVRVSTAEQANHGVSLDAQQSRIRAYAALQEREIAEVIVDAGESAKTLQRPGIVRLLNDVRGGKVGCVVVYKLDRLSRSVKDLITILELLEKHNVGLVSICESVDTKTAAGQFMLHLLGAVGQLEVRQVSERTKFALAHKRERREAYSPVPFGFRRDVNKLIPEPHEQLALRIIQGMRQDGATLREIAEWLSANEYKPKGGASRWYASTVRYVLKTLPTRQSVSEAASV